jgi:hypothetical protein
MFYAMEQIRRMRGGAQSHLMRCSDGDSHELYFVVKFQNNPQHRRILVNELLGTRLAARLGLPTTPVAIIEVREELIRLTPDLSVELPRSRIPCQPGLQFGSRYPGDPRRLTVHDFLPDEQLRQVQNLHDFAGMLVFDKWACNTNGRQTVFFQDIGEGTDRLTRAGTAQASPLATEDPELPYVPYKAKMIDQGFCFNAGEWNYPDAPLRGLYARNRVYEGVTGMESFGPWMARVESLTERALGELVKEIPPEWYEDDYDALLRLLEHLYRRKTLLPGLLLAAKNSNRQPFPNWR